MDLSNLINTEINEKMSDQFNSAELNFEIQDINNLSGIAKTDYYSQDYEQKETKDNLLKDMFTALANNKDISFILNELTQKYGSFFDRRTQNICIKLFNLIGNYFITCKYNDDKGNKNPNLIKYVLHCDCVDNEYEVCNQEIPQQGIDGFLGKQKIQQQQQRFRMCKKHGLKVLANLQDLDTNDFNELVKKVSQIKSIPIKEASKGANSKNIISNIKTVFANCVVKKIAARNDAESFKMKEANIDLKADTTKQFISAKVENVAVPKSDKVKTMKATKYDQVGLPVNNLAVSVKNKKASIENVSMKAVKPKNIELDNTKLANVSVTGKNINVAVQKESKMIQNISIYTEVVDQGFNMNNENLIEVSDISNNDVDIDFKNSFDF